MQEIQAIAYEVIDEREFNWNNGFPHNEPMPLIDEFKPGGKYEDYECDGDEKALVINGKMVVMGDWYHTQIDEYINGVILGMNWMINTFHTGSIVLVVEKDIIFSADAHSIPSY